MPFFWGASDPLRANRSFISYLSCCLEATVILFHNTKKFQLARQPNFFLAFLIILHYKTLSFLRQIPLILFLIDGEIQLF